tara:strand:- start:8424 stop:9320 length:897 start_codon:yes stop_codon:yes gene_type:complete
MAINTLRTNVAKNLNAIGFKKITGQHDLSPRDSFKKIIQRGDGLDFNVVDNFTFTVSIQDENYYRALTADFNYSLTRIKRQKDTLEYLLIKKSLPSAWMIVTSYYLAFYSAIEILRLSGRHNFYFNDNDIKDINSYSQTTSKLTGMGVYLCNNINSNSSSGEVSLRFRKDGSRPHDITWSCISTIMGPRSTIKCLTNIEERKITLLFKDIIDKNNQAWMSPNNIRNKWNYSKAEYYSIENDYIANSMKSILASDDYDVAKKWARNRFSTIDESSFCSGLAFVVKTLESTIDSISNKII